MAEYLKTRNQTDAARRAGYKSPEVEASRLLRNAKVAAAVAEGQAERTERTKIDIAYVVQRLAVEAERTGEGATHAARVAALGHLRQHFAALPKSGDDVPALNINITSDAPVRGVRVTRSEG